MAAIARISPPKLFRPVAMTAAYLVIFLSLDKVSSLFVTSANVSPWYPPPGVSLALLLVYGLDYVPAVCLAVILSATLIYNELALGLPFGQFSLLAIGTALTIAVGYGVIALILKRWLRINLRLAQPRDVFLFIAAALLGPMVIALAGVGILAAVGLTAPADFGDAVFNWWIGDAIGLMVITPLALVIAIPGFRMLFHSGLSGVWRWLRSQRLAAMSELAAQIAAAVGVLWLIFLWSETRQLHMYYLCFLPLIWAALRFGLRGAVVGNLVFNLAIVLGASVYHYHLDSLTDLQVFMLVLCLTGLALGATVSQRQSTENALRESEQRFRTILEISPSPILITRVADGEILYANANLWTMFGFAPDEQFIGRRALDLYYEEADRQEVIKEIRAKGSVHGLVARAKKANGDLFWIIVSSQVTAFDGNSALISSFYDITERKQMEDTIRKSESRLRTMLDASPVPLVISRLSDGVVLHANRQFLTLFGLSPEQVIGNKAVNLFYASTEVREDLISRLASDGSIRNRESQYTKLDGTTIWLSYNIELSQLDGDNILMVGSYDITELKRIAEELRRLNTDLENRVSERTAELTRANERLKELDRLKSKFVADVSHELRTPITGLQLRLGIAERHPERMDEHLTILKDYIQRLANLVESVLDLSRIDLGAKKAVFSPVNLNHVIEREIAVHQPQAQAARLNIILDLDKTLPLVRGEANQLGQVVSNLTSNAIRYTPAGFVRIRTFVNGESSGVCLEVSDSGLGIAPEDVPHLFERFYRGQTALKGDIPGSGLGLSIVKEIVELHNGAIVVESQIGSGATFRVCLPAVASEAERLPSAALSG